MSTDKSYVDKDGYVKEWNFWSGQYEQQVDWLGTPVRDVNIFGTPNIQSGWFGPVEAKGFLGSNIHSADGQVLLERNETTSASRSAAGADVGGVLAGAALLAGGVVALSVADAISSHWPSGSSSSRSTTQSSSSTSTTDTASSIGGVFFLAVVLGLVAYFVSGYGSITQTSQSPTSANTVALPQAEPAPLSASTIDAESMTVLPKEGVNVRSSPGEKSVKITALPQGTKVVLVGTESQLNGYVWVFVEAGSNRGWIRRDLLRPLATIEVPIRLRITKNVKWANIRRTPGAINKPDSDIVTVVKSGTELEVLDGFQVLQGVTWWHVRAGSAEGWVAEQSEKYGLLVEPVNEP